MAQIDPPVIKHAPRPDQSRRRRLGKALAQRRRLRTGIVQLAYIAGAIALGVVVPRIAVAPAVPTSRTAEMLVAVGAGFVPFIGIVFSLLFFVVQFGSTTFTPRLNLFRDAPIVWHAFSFFTAVIVFSFTAAFEIGSAPETSLLVPIVLGVAVVAAIALLRSLQAAAFRSIQLASILEQVAKRGREVIDGVYPETLASTAPGRRDPGDVSSAAEVPSGGREVRWPGRSSILQTLDVPRLLRLAEREDALIHLRAAPGETIAERDRVAVILGGRGVTDREVLHALKVGSERTFEQDPALALRVLADIALRALSPAVNDPTTAVQSLDAIDDLLRVLAQRHLGIELVEGSDGAPRLVLKLPTWEDYVSVALDEIISIGSGSIQVGRRVRRLLEELLALAPSQHRQSVESRLEAVSAALQNRRGGPCVSGPVGSPA